MKRLQPKPKSSNGTAAPNALSHFSPKENSSDSAEEMEYSNYTHAGTKTIFSCPETEAYSESDQEAPSGSQPLQLSGNYSNENPNLRPSGDDTIKGITSGVSPDIFTIEDCEPDNASGISTLCKDIITEEATSSYESLPMPYEPIDPVTPPSISPTFSSRFTTAFKKEPPCPDPLTNAAWTAKSELEKLPLNEMTEKLLNAYQSVLNVREINQAHSPLLLLPKDYANLKGIPLVDVLPEEVHSFAEMFKCQLLSLAQKNFYSSFRRSYHWLIDKLANENESVKQMNKIYNLITSKPVNKTALKSIILNFNTELLTQIKSPYNNDEITKEINELSELIGFMKIAFCTVTMQECAISILKQIQANNADYSFEAAKEEFLKIAENDLHNVTLDLLSPPPLIWKDLTSSDFEIINAIKAFNNLFQQELLEVSQQSAYTKCM